MSDLLALSALELSRAYAEGRTSPSEVLELALDRASGCEPAVNAFVEFKADEARAMAQASGRRWHDGAPLSVLDGSVTAVKDTMQFAGWPLGRGSRLTSGAPPAAGDSTAIAALRAAGLVFMGRTTVPEFAHKTVTASPATGDTRNPWNPEMTAGGSSGGAAVAVATGANVLAVGTDAGGSIRVPCSYCGLFGLKPTFGRVHQFPPTPTSMLVHTGPMTRCVADARALMVILAPSTDWVETVSSLAGVRVAVASNVGLQPHTASAEAGLNDTATWLAEAGCQLADVTLDLSWAERVFEILFCSGAQLTYESYEPYKQREISASFRGLAEIGQTYAKRDYQLALAESQRRKVELTTWFEKYDLLLCPASVHGPFPIGRDIPAHFGDAPWYRTAGHSTAFNISGHPAAAVPVGLDAAALPVSVQLVGRHGADALVLDAAEAIEARAGFRGLVHRPDLLDRLVGRPYLRAQHSDQSSSAAALVS